MEEDAHNNSTSGKGKQKDVESSKDIKTIIGIPKRATTSSNSPPQEGNEGECEMYKYVFNQVSFDYDKHRKSSYNNWREFTCSFCVLNNHNVSRCWKKMTTYKKLSKQKRQKTRGPLDNGNHVAKKMQLFCPHCDKQGHLIDKFWTLYPTTHPLHLKKVERDFGKNEKYDTIIDVGQDDSQDVADERSAMEMVW